MATQPSASDVRPLPLKIAAIIGVLLFGVYLALLFSSEITVGAVFWAVVLGAATVLSWFADQLGRRSAQVAAGMFFVLGILSSIAYALVLLVAVVLCVIGFVRFDSDDNEETA